jgi:hypothetical protein
MRAPFEEVPAPVTGHHIRPVNVQLSVGIHGDQHLANECVGATALESVHNRRRFDFIVFSLIIHEIEDPHKP